MEEENTLDTIRAFLRHTPKQEAEKLSFLASICTLCGTTSVDSSMRDILSFYKVEMVMTIKSMLQEESTNYLGTTVRQQAMLAIISMSPSRCKERL